MSAKASAGRRCGRGMADRGFHVSRSSVVELGHSIVTTFLGFRGFTVQCQGMLDRAGM